MNITVEIARFGLKVFAHHRFRFKVTYENFDPKRKEPYFLIGNHTQSNDPLYLGMFLKHYPYPVANALLYTKPILRFGLTKIVKSIEKRKGQSDISTIKAIMHAFKTQSRGVMLFPEGNASYFGQQTTTDFTSTAKLLKKVKHDVIMAKINGGFFAQPRWGKHVKKGAYHIHFYRLFSKDALETQSIEAISNNIHQAMQFNDYDWNRQMQIPYISKHKAHGLASYMYVCPKCQSIQSIYTKGNDIYCKTCRKISSINTYNFLTGLPFDNLVDWGDYQASFLPKIVLNDVISYGHLYHIDFSKKKRIKKDEVKIIISQQKLSLTGKKINEKFLLKDISGIALTQKDFISFDIDGQTFDIKVKDPKLILDTINYLKGEH